MNEERRIRRDVGWNFCAFVLIALSGVALNLIIARAYDATTLGVFNQVLTFYIILGQVAVFGIHFSVLRSVSEHSSTPDTLKEVVSSGVLLVLPISLVVATIFYFLAALAGTLLYSDAVIGGVTIIIPAVVLFALNKVMINVLNGLRMMRAFAIAQASRPLLFAIGILAASLLGLESTTLPWVILWSEFAIFLVLTTWITRTSLLSWRLRSMEWLKVQLNFGTKAFIGGGLSEANSRVDILIAGSLLTDREVGVYSLASMIVEGLVQLPSILRNTINPLITQFASAHDWIGLRRLCIRAARHSYAMMLVAVGLAIALFPWGVQVIVGNAEFAESWPILVAACTGVLIAAGALPLEMFLLQVGFPSLHTLFKAIVLGANILITALLIAALGVLGAGIAVGAMHLISALILVACIKLVQTHIRDATRPESAG